MKRSRDSFGRFDSRPTASMTERFESQFVRIPEAGCWIWMGALKNKYGHGAFKLGGRSSPVDFAHRVSWKLYLGDIPEGSYVLHHCDNPLCVNPDHLFLGSHKENMADMVAKDRQAKGSKCLQAKIDEKVAATIKQMKETPTKVLASIFGISRQSVADILYGRTWRHV